MHGEFIKSRGNRCLVQRLLFYVVAIDSSGVRNFLSDAVVYRGNLPWWSAIGWILPLNPESFGLVVLLFAIPAICGALGKLPAMTTATVLSTLAAALLGGIHAHDLQTYSHGEFPAASWPAILAPYALVSWPVLARHRLSRLGQ